ncbi:class I SAM-dependent methyltransferase [Nakamurella sp. GG22]
MLEPAAEHRFYGDLSPWWPLISPPEEYAEEAAFVGSLLADADGPVESVLELGSGGGHNAVHLTPHFTLTLVDLSDGMLTVSRRLNLGCEHIQGDMRDVRLGRTFDAVLIHDAIDYMTTEADLRLAVRTAFEHCRPGGTAVFVPDATVETFEPYSDHGGVDDPATSGQSGAAPGRGVRYLEWTWDPDPSDSWVQTDYAFLLRDGDGTVDAVHETHRTGLFSVPVWLQVLRDEGFRATTVREETTEDRTPRVVFVGRRPR